MIDKRNKKAAEILKMGKFLKTGLKYYWNFHRFVYLII